MIISDFITNFAPVIIKLICHMKHLIISIALIMCSAFVLLADSDNSSSSDNSGLELKPLPAKPSKRPTRMPAMPIYGEYVNPVLRLFVDDSEESLYSLTISKDDIEIESVSLTGMELNSGYEVSVAAPFEIELSVENELTYSGEVL